MRNNYSDDQLHLAARLYYVNGMGQDEVAKFVKVSQAKVSRLLALARERGIVRITVADYEPRERELETRLRVQLGLGAAIVIKAADNLPPSDLRKSLGLFASEAFAGLIEPKSIIAISGGRTVHALVQNVPASPSTVPTVVQSMGSVDSNINAFDAQEIGRTLSQRLGGSFVAMNTPAHVHDKKLRDALLGLDQVRSVNSLFDKANFAVVGIGTLDNSVFVDRGVFKDAEIEALKETGAVGEVCGRFFDASGKECDTSWRDRVMSIELEQLAKIPLVIGVVVGTDRSASIKAAIAGGFIKGLVIDEPGARALLGSFPQTSVSKTKSTKKKK